MRDISLFYQALSHEGLGIRRDSGYGEAAEADLVNEDRFALDS